MLVQLLGKHSMGARLMTNPEVGRDRIDELDVDGAQMTRISYLNISGSPAHLRYLIQRLRRRMPKGAPLSALQDPAILAQVDADDNTSSLSEAVSSCVEAAAKEAGQPAKLRVA